MFAFDCFIRPSAIEFFPLYLKITSVSRGAKYILAISRNFNILASFTFSIIFSNSSGLLKEPSNLTVKSRAAVLIVPAG